MKIILCLIALWACNTQAQNLFDLNEVLTGAESSVAIFQSGLDNAILNVNDGVAQTQDLLLNSVSSASDQNVAPLSDRMAALEALAADFNRQATVDTQVLINNIANSASQRIGSETNARLAVQNTLTAVYSNILVNANSGFASASTSRSNIWALMSNTRSSIVGASSASLASAIVNEQTRANSESAFQSTQVANVEASSSSALANAIAVEASRADAFCANVLATSGAGIPTAASGNNDWQNCTSAQTGNLYYSSANGAVFFCDGVVFQSILFGGFSDSVILARGQMTAMSRITGSNWVNCYRSSRDGFSGYIFRGSCANRGPTIIIARSTTNNQIFGGYADASWGNRQCNYMWSTISWVYRYNPASVNQIQQAVVTSGGQQYAFYDCPTHGPTFGGGHDIYFNSGLSGYTNPSSYSPGYASLVQGSTTSSSSSGLTSGCSSGGGGGTVPLMSYSSSALAGTYSFSINSMEVYYMY